MARRIEALSAWEIASSSATTKQLRREYSKLAYKARQRLGAIEKTYGPKAEVVQRRSGDFKPLSQLGKINRTQLAQELADTRRFLASDSSRVKEYGQVRQNAVESFHRAGYEFVNEENLDDLYQFLEDARARHLGSIYGSDQLIEVFERAQKRGMSSEQLLGNIEYWAENTPKQPRLYASRKSSREDFVEGSKKWLQY